jgi:hypothetical protein
MPQSLSKRLTTAGDSGQENIREIVDGIIAEEGVSVQFGLVKYRDHPPQDSSFVTQVSPFTDDMSACPVSRVWDQAPYKPSRNESRSKERVSYCLLGSGGDDEAVRGRDEGRRRGGRARGGEGRPPHDVLCAAWLLSFAAPVAQSSWRSLACTQLINQCNCPRTRHEMMMAVLVAILMGLGGGRACRWRTGSTRCCTWTGAPMPPRW